MSKTCQHSNKAKNYILFCGYDGYNASPITEFFDTKENLLKFLNEEISPKNIIDYNDIDHNSSSEKYYIIYAGELREELKIVPEKIYSQFKINDSN